MINCTNNCTLLITSSSICAIFSITWIWTMWIVYKYCKCFNKFRSIAKCIIMNIVWWLFSFYIFKKKIRINIYILLGYIHPNLVIKTLIFFCQTPLYINAKVSSKPNWQGFGKLANTKQDDQLQKDEFEKIIILIIQIILKRLKKIFVETR